MHELNIDPVLTAAALAPGAVGSASGSAISVWPATTIEHPHGRLLVGGVCLTDIAASQGTPVYVLDEAEVRERCRTYRTAFPEAEIHYAAKAFLCGALVHWVDAGSDPSPRQRQVPAGPGDGATPRCGPDRHRQSPRDRPDRRCGRGKPRPSEGHGPCHARHQCRRTPQDPYGLGGPEVRPLPRGRPRPSCRHSHTGPVAARTHRTPLPLGLTDHGHQALLRGRTAARRSHDQNPSHPRHHVAGARPRRRPRHRLPPRRTRSGHHHPRPQGAQRAGQELRGSRTPRPTPDH